LPQHDAPAAGAVRHAAEKEQRNEIADDVHGVDQREHDRREAELLRIQRIQRRHDRAAMNITAIIEPTAASLPSSEISADRTDLTQYAVARFPTAMVKVIVLALAVR
jgi:hypothetical protein